MSDCADALVVDAHRPRAAGVRAVVEVAVGLLIREQQQFLLCTRPPGKAYAGYWEFPGGKLEAGEDILTALTRELQEEIGITVRDATAWKVLTVDYPHALVHLHFWRVTRWGGVLQMREGQQCSWETLPVQVSPVLPGTVPVLTWMAAEQRSAPKH